MCERCGLAKARFVILSEALRMKVCGRCAAESRGYPGLRIATLVEPAVETLPDFQQERKVSVSRFDFTRLTPFQRILLSSVSR